MIEPFLAAVNLIRIAQFQASKPPAFLYLFLYVALIPVTAGAYHSLGDQFFHSTAQFERDVRSDGEQLREDIHSIIVDQFVEQNDGRTTEIEGWTIDIGHFQINQAYFSSGKLNLRMYMSFQSDTMQISGPQTYQIDIRPTFVAGWPGSDEQHVIKFLSSDTENSWPVKDSLLFGSPRGIGTGSAGFRISRDLQSRLTSLHRSYEGFPAEATGSYARMLYFSAVTQTTLGYGDIVPTSHATRFLVGIQSVFGILLIGLFLNSLARPEGKEEPNT